MSPHLLALHLLVSDPVALDWRAPAGCPDADAVLTELAALTELAPTPRPRVRVTATTRASGPRHTLDLRIQTASMSLRRRLTADACDTLGQVAARLIAIALDPLEVAAQVGSEPATPQLREPATDLPLAVTDDADEPPPAPPIQDLPTTTREPSPTRPSRPRTRGLVRLDGALDTGATAGLAGDLALAAGLLRGPLRLELLALYTPPRPLHRDAARVGALARWSVGARACGRIVQDRLEIPLCAGLEAGQLLGSGAGITVERQSARPPWFARLAGLGLTWTPHPRVGLGARAELVLAPLRAQFSVGGRLVHTVDAAGLRVSLGVELRFGPGDGTATIRPRPP